MDNWGFTWEAHNLTTEDGYILTMFHLTGKVDESEPRAASVYNPMLFKNCYFSDSADWFGNPEDFAIPPMPVRMFEDGFDIWLGDDRGTEYCQEHVSLTKWDPEFWAWSWSEMGVYDNVAYLEFIKNETGKKVSYLGVSQATNVLFYALSRMEDRLVESLASVSQLDPCTIAVSEGEDIYRNGLFKFPDYGIYNLGGPGWDKSLVKICLIFDKDVCEWASTMTGVRPSSVQNEIHWA